MLATSTTNKAIYQTLTYRCGILHDRPAFKMNIYHKLKVSYIIRHVIIKHALVKELLILQVQNDDIKP